MAAAPLLNTIGRELKVHAPFTALGTLSGVLIMFVLIVGDVPRLVTSQLFWIFHPLHVLLSALVTTAMFRLYGGKGFWRTLWIGYIGSVGIATLSDSVLPFLAEWMLRMPNRGLHLGFIEKWWLVNPLALLGVALAVRWPHTKCPHSAHVLLSTWASLFHITMALGGTPDLMTFMLIVVFLFLAVWLPCCTSDIVFPLLFSPQVRPAATGIPESVHGSTGSPQ
jgi:hypothetical protein